MKVSLNKNSLAEIKTANETAYNIIIQWKEQYKKRHINIVNAESVYIQEDYRYTVISPATSQAKTGQASGEFSNLGDFSCNQTKQLPPGMLIVETGFFLGVPNLAIYYNNGIKQLARHENV